MSAKAVLLGTITSTQVTAALERNGYRVSTLGADKEHVRLGVLPESTDEDRVLWVFGPEVSMTDSKGLCSGERTLCSLGASGSGPDIVRVLAEEFGGYHQPTDANDDWVAVEGRHEVELTPSQNLQVAFQRALTPDLAIRAARILEGEPESLAILRDAIDLYLDQPAPGPRA